LIDQPAALGKTGRLRGFFSGRPVASARRCTNNRFRRIPSANRNRRIFTDGRDWPKDMHLTLQGHSIGKWIDTDGDGRFDTLEVETRRLRGPRAFDANGMPMFSDPDSRVLERISIDKSNPNVMLDEISTID
jgi:hypothetical protein